MSNASISENERKHTSSSPLRKYAIQQFFDVVNAFLPSVDTVLDAGCGEGYDVAAIQKHHPNMTIYGVDISAAAVQKSQQIAPELHAVRGSVLSLPYAPKSFDCVLSLEVLEHLDDPSTAIEEYKQISRRYLLLSVPNEPIFRGLRMLNGMNIAQWGNHPEHVQHWNRRTFEHFLQSHGLTVLKSATPIPYIWTVVLCEVPASNSH